MKMIKKPFVGTHVIGEILGSPTAKLKSAKLIEKSISSIIFKNHLKKLGCITHRFRGGGYTIVVCLAESHIALHTWPEKYFATLDVYACDYYRKNKSNAVAVFEEIALLLDPIKIHKRVYRR